MAYPARPRQSVRIVTTNAEESAEYPEIYAEVPAVVRTQRKPKRPKPKGANTICCTFKRFRAFYNWCIERGYTQNNPFAKFKGIGTEKYGRPYYISVAEVEKIADFDLSENPALAVQCDIFVFQCLIGCRVSDLMRMTDNSVIDGAVEYIPDKTKGERPEVLRVPLNNRAKEQAATSRDVPLSATSTMKSKTPILSELYQATKRAARLLLVIATLTRK